MAPTSADSSDLSGQPPDYGAPETGLFFFLSRGGLIPAPGAGPCFLPALVVFFLPALLGAGRRGGPLDRVPGEG